ncbi:OmpA/MotB domain protein [Fibrella aestuarina BUZ 2]|uniref:OmpA/MotB domain protein n=1 Tax=Fibrella aestuarina BUZ 2 TaxID=1166018 RepID=I0K3A4_9BACT|nr:OmpA family protein [Fibrella aestuarina]CCG98607.1 OmpA/MotB domain protein [Fibrella aestuarina BUZ 2]
MAVNLIDMAKSYLTDAVISRISNSLGESPEGTQKAVVGALPLFLSSLISRSSTPEGAGFLSRLLQQAMPSATTSATVDANDPDTLMQRGSGLVDSLFGPSSNLVSGVLSQYAGVKTSSASSLLGLAGSLITGALGRQVASPNGGFDVSRIMGLLGDQKDSIAAAMPSGLSALLGNVPGLGSLTSGLAGATGAVGSTLAGAGAAAASAFGNKPSSTPVSTPAYADDDNRAGGFNFWPWVLAALAAGLIYYFVRGCGDKPTDATTTTTSTVNDTTSAAVQDATATVDTAQAAMEAMADTASSAIANAASNAAAALGAFGAKKLPDGVELNIPANGIESKLIAFIEDASKPVDKTTWFNFDRLLYETASAKLKPESREQLQNIAAILKAYPAVNLKIGGYTDNTGNAAANKKLSQDRAESAMKELVNLGVAASRLEAEGYGSEYPVASNATEEGRAQNRRTSCRVTKK